MEKITKRLGMLLMALLFLVPLASCGSDDDGPSGEEISDYYITCESVSGGGISAMDREHLQSFITNTLTSRDAEWEGFTYNEAKYAFDKVLEELADDDRWLEEIQDTMKKGTLSIVFALKNKAGNKVSTKTMHISSEGCEID